MMQRKRYIFCLALSMFSFVLSGFAQTGKSEISVSYGLWSAYTLANGMPYSASSGVGMINYKYYLSKRVNIGMTVGYENIGNDGSYLHFVPEFTYAYYDNKNDRIRVRMYSGAAVGIAVFDDLHTNNGVYSTYQDNSGPKITGQATVFGMRIGRKIGGFLELGYGYKGIVTGGIGYRFSTKAKKSAETN